MKRRAFLVAAGLLVASCYAASGWASQSTVAEAQKDYNAGRYNRVVDTLNSITGSYPNDAGLLFLLGQSYYQLRDYSRAITNFEHSVQLAPNTSLYHDWLGKAYGRKAEESVFLSALTWARKTHREFQTAVDLDPQNFEAQRDLIRFEINAPGIVGGGDEKALKHIGDLDKLDHVQGQLARGEFLATKKRLSEADAVFDQLLESSSNNPGVYFEVGDYYRDRQNAEKFGTAVAAAQRIAPDDPRLKFYQGVLLVVEKQEPREAEALLKSYLTSVPDNSDLPSHAAAHEWLGRLYESQSRFSEAAERYRLALTLDPRNRALEDDFKRVEKK